MSNAKMRMPSIYKFHRDRSARCNGRIVSHVSNDGSVEASFFSCTIHEHLVKKSLTLDQKNYIKEKLELGMDCTQVRANFSKQYYQWISRHQINNIKYQFKIFYEYRTNSSDLISTRNLIQNLEQIHRVDSNINQISALEELVLVIQFSQQKNILDKNSKILSIDSTHSITKYFLVKHISFNSTGINSS